MKMKSAVLAAVFVVVVAFAHFSVICADRGEGHGDRVKHGVCPKIRDGVVGPCIERCSKDRDCPNALKCCSNGCGHVCTKPYIEKPGHCPSRDVEVLWSCKKPCSNDYDCPKAKKCCSVKCGNTCIEPDSLEKPGSCPMTIGAVEPWGESCSNDFDCPGKEKCCSGFFGQSWCCDLPMCRGH